MDVSGADAYPSNALRNYAVPAKNPIPTYNAANPAAPIAGLGEVYVTGIRNASRVSFDRATGDLWMGDVAEVRVEEVNFLRAGSNAAGPPADFGWPQREGTQGSGIPGAPQTRTNPFTGATSVEPVQQFTHTAGGNAVIGGYLSPRAGRVIYRKVLLRRLRVRPGVAARFRPRHGPVRL